MEEKTRVTSKKLNYWWNTKMWMWIIMVKRISSVYRTKEMGPISNPERRLFSLLTTTTYLFYHKNVFQCIEYGALNQSNEIPLIPCLSGLFRSNTWLTTSNALVPQKFQIRTYPLSFMASRTTFRSANYELECWVTKTWVGKERVLFLQNWEFYSTQYFHVTL